MGENLEARVRWSRTIPFFTSLKEVHVYLAQHMKRGERVVRVSLSPRYSLYQVGVELWRDGK